MKILITGGCKNGKSSLAQKLACALAARKRADPAGQHDSIGHPYPFGKLYYLATMIPRDEEDRARIARHREDREGLGFTTLEWGCSLSGHLSELDSTGTYLLDSLTALLSNEMFHPAPDGTWGGADDEAGGRLSRDLRRLSERVRDLIVVSDGIYSDACIYEEETERYRASLATLEKGIAQYFDTVIECCAGIPVFHKGSWPAGCENLAENYARCGEGGKLQKAQHSGRIAELIIGGAYQGKTAYLQAKYSLPPEELCDLRTQEPDLNRRAFLHLEGYLRRCVESGKEPTSPETFREDAVVVCEDIFCGVVPIDAADRAWREALGRYLLSLSAGARRVTRVICGIPEVLR